MIVFDSCEFNDHIENICVSVKQRVGWLLRQFKDRSVEFMRFLWRTFLLPKIDYCSQLWGKLPTTLLQRLESLQHSFTAMIPDLKELDYWSRLQFLNLQSIERRFDQYRLIYFWNILEAQVPNFGMEWVWDDYNGRLGKVPQIVRK